MTDRHPNDRTSYELELVWPNGPRRFVLDTLEEVRDLIEFMTKQYGEPVDWSIQRVVRTEIDEKGERVDG